MGGMVIWWVVIVALLAAAAWFIANQARRGGGGGGVRMDESPEQVLKRRYARGEIDRESYQRMLEDVRV